MNPQLFEDAPRRPTVKARFHSVEMVAPAKEQIFNADTSASSDHENERLRKAVGDEAPVLQQKMAECIQFVSTSASARMCLSHLESITRRERTQRQHAPVHNSSASMHAGKEV